ncbi:hypothetical protein B0H14DRAFT_2603730 [Mycena olivaceomarginata]|nr:hypothetical protein B0H14DRAFT_2603730 [Mycena olivaceomarginata]
MVMRTEAGKDAPSVPLTEEEDSQSKMEARLLAPPVKSAITKFPSKLSRDRRTKTAVSKLDDKKKAAAKARLREAKVKKPALTSLTSPDITGDFGAYARSKALRWALNTDTFILSIDINDLKNRPKNTEELKSRAAQSIKAMENQPEDAASAVFKDKNGITLACVFARRSPNATKIHGAYPGTLGRTLEHFWGTPRNEEDYDGLNARFSLLISVSGTLNKENIGSHTDPSFHRDVRHDEDEKYMVYTPSGSTSEKSERAGVTHLVHCWTMQGHSKGPFMPSSDFFRGCQAALAVKHYYRATREVAIYLGCMFEVAFPEYHAKYTKAFKAGVWESADPGPWIGRAIVYNKLQMMAQLLHSAWGDFDGGSMYLPDISMKLSYRQGDILIFMSGLLYHCVGKWSPGGEVSPEGITPGRISHVFFSPQNSIAQLDGKPEGWMIRTMGGSNVDSDVDVRG